MVHLAIVHFDFLALAAHIHAGFAAIAHGIGSVVHLMGVTGGSSSG
jgi:hypothetical protein